MDAWDNFDNTGKKSFSYLEEWSQKSKKFVKGVYAPHWKSQKGDYMTSYVNKGTSYEEFFSKSSFSA